MAVVAAQPESYALNMIVPRQIRAARALVGWTQEDLAAKASVSVATLNNIERGVADPRVSTLNAIEKALRDAGVIFIDQGPYSGAGGSGVRLAD